MKRILSYLKPFRLRMLVGFLIKVTGTMAELVLPYILTYILEDVIDEMKVGKVVAYGGLMVFFAAVACLGNIIANRMAARVTTNFSKAMRKELFEKTLYLSSADTDAFTIPSLESRITTDTYNVHNFIGMMQRMGVRAPILLLGGISLTLIMDSALALVMIATLPIIFVTVYGISRKGVPLYTRVQKSVDGMVRVAREDTQGIRVIKALSKNEHENRRYDKVNAELSKQERRAGTIMGIVNPSMTLLMNLGIAAVVAVAALRVAKGLSSPATVIAFMQYFTLISMAMMSLSRMFVMYTKCAASANRIAEVLDTPDKFDVVADSNANDGIHIAFENVSFSYLSKKNNIQNLSLSLRKGERLGIIGATGSGKSTFIKLLLRFYEPDSGKILINGRDIKSYSREKLTSMFGVALQNDFIYADTIEENIRFGRDIPTENIIKAAKTAQAHDFITATADGYSHMLSSKGTNLSGGQRQRVLIARALASNPEILILDDSSSALDYKTDANLRKALDENMSGSTVITVAQRVSSVKSCDHIIVIEDGQVIGQGKHEHLLETCAEYREISESQMGGAFVE
ncbi:MAG: ABC transporter ATP-binding protein [Acutalibacteraceae bacterium]|nr:ABC transporter ATP-binding protein [Acutalibacteraceae bacterium]